MDKSNEQSEILKTEDDVEKILRIAVSLPPIHDSTTLRGRLESTAEELGLSPEQVRAAEEQYRSEVQQKGDINEFIEQQRAGLIQSLVIYLAVNIFLFIIDLRDGELTWFFYPLLGWGIGIAGHAAHVLNTKSESFKKSFEDWKKSRN